MSVGISDTEHTTPENIQLLVFVCCRLCICTHSTPPTQAGTLTDSKHINPGRDRRAEHCRVQACATGVGKNSSSSSSTALGPTPSKESHLVASCAALRTLFPRQAPLHSHGHAHTNNPFTTRAAGMRCCSKKTAAYDRQTFRSPAEAERALGAATLHSAAQHTSREFSGGEVLMGRMPTPSVLAGAPHSVGLHATPTLTLLAPAHQSFGACAVGVPRRGSYTRGMATSRSKTVMWPLRMRSWKKPLMLLRHCSP